MTKLAVYAQEAPLAPASPDVESVGLSLTHWRLPDLPVPMTSDRCRWGFALSLAFITHAALLFALAREPSDRLAGGGGKQIDAISVTLVSSDVLESRETRQQQQTAPVSTAAVETMDGAPDSAAAAVAKERKEKKEQEAEQKEPAEEPVRDVEATTQVPSESQHQLNQARAAPAAGGVAARSEMGNMAKASAPAAASAGAMREYARYVTQALTKTKPKGIGGFGTVRIKFVIAAGGELALAEVAKSSGSTKLDQIALAAVQRTRFPLPPPGMTVTQLTYEVPYNFR